MTNEVTNINPSNKLSVDERVELYSTWLDDPKHWNPTRASVIKEFLQKQHIELLKLQKSVSAEERIRAYFAGQQRG